MCLFENHTEYPLEQELIRTSSQKTEMYLFFLLCLDYVCNLTTKIKSFKILWMLKWWLPVNNCPRQLETNTSNACQREHTTHSPSLSMQIYSTIGVNTPYMLLLQTFSLNSLHPPSASTSTTLNGGKYYFAIPAGSR